MSYIILKDRSCDIILNVHAPNEDKGDDMKDSIYGEIEQAFLQFPRYEVKI
jgi:hypothetical protein